MGKESYVLESNIQNEWNDGTKIHNETNKMPVMIPN